MVWSTAMLPPAPVRFSTSTCWPMLSLMNLATTRATVSVPPPGSKPTTMLIGFDGKVCASAWLPTNANSASRDLISLPREYRLALLHESLAALLVVGALEALLRPRAGLGGVVVELAELADDALRGAHGERRVGGDHLGVLGHGLFQVHR